MMNYLYPAGGLLLLAALFFYLAAPHQKLMVFKSSPLTLVSFAIVAAALSLFFLAKVMSVLVSVFTLLVVLMLLFSTLPLFIAYQRYDLGGDK